MNQQGASGPDRRTGRRRFLASMGASAALAAAGWRPGCTPGTRVPEQAAAAATPAPPSEPVPMLHVTDLFRPPNDPDDHWDLACVYALAWQGRVDLRGILIDFPMAERHNDPDVLAVAQLNYLTQRSVPVMVGVPRTVTLQDAARMRGRAELGGIRTLLAILGSSPRPVVINTLGSCHDVALAARLEPKLFAKRCAAVYVNAGSGSPDPAKTTRPEWNVHLDPAGYAAMFRLPCPLYWMPCFEQVPQRGGQFRTARYGTWYRFRQDQVLPHLSRYMQNYFGFLYDRSRPPTGAGQRRADWLQYLLGDPDSALLERQGRLFRNMWCTAGFLHAAGLTVTRQGSIEPIETAADPVFTFEPVRVKCTPGGVTEWKPAPEASGQWAFRVLDTAAYAAAMTRALKSLLASLP